MTIDNVKKANNKNNNNICYGCHRDVCICCYTENYSVGFLTDDMFHWASCYSRVFQKQLWNRVHLAS
jgi:hypothetical protein